MSKHPSWVLLPLSLACACAFANTGDEGESQELNPVVVSGTPTGKANSVQFNPKTSIQPLPANDGASVLQSVPNMSIIRKGGSSGDPLLRGLGGSRLSIQADGQFIYGGCGNRMDPPTAYIFPASFDKVIVTKGPQSVSEGMGMVAGSVRFVRKTPPKAEEFKAHGNAGLTVGSFDRFDIFADAELNNRYGYLRANASYNKSGNYRDGDGNRVHSHFSRHNQMLQLGVTPTENTVLSAGYERSRGEAAYADRMMDGSKFDRDAWTLKAQQRSLTPWLSEISASYGRSKVDHIMDNYTMRRRAPNMRALINPERIVDTAQLRATMNWSALELQTGLDWTHDRHNSRMANGMMRISGANVDRLSSFPFVGDQDFRQYGLFAEATLAPKAGSKVIGGLRYDRVKAEYLRKLDPADPDALYNAHRNQTYNLKAAFVRYEQQLGESGKYYVGLGMAERAPDYWERNRSYRLKAERNTQLDTGYQFQSGNVQGSVSLFAGHIKDFILVKGASADNVKAVRYGGEAEGKWKFARNWELGGSLAYTYGKNRSDSLPLAQTPPLEAKTFLNWDNGTFSAGALWRVVAAQKRYARGQGNIVGTDIGPSAGFGVLSLNAGWRFHKQAVLQAGVDNVFNKTYAEFVSKGGNPAAGTQTIRVNEPGRQVWLRLQASF